MHTVELCVFFANVGRGCPGFQRLNVTGFPPPKRVSQDFSPEGRKSPEWVRMQEMILQMSLGWSCPSMSLRLTHHHWPGTRFRINSWFGRSSQLPRRQCKRWRVLFECFWATGSECPKALKKHAVGHFPARAREKPININILGGTVSGTNRNRPGTNGTPPRDKLGPVPGTNRPSPVQFHSKSAILSVCPGAGGGSSLGRLSHKGPQKNV